MVSQSHNYSTKNEMNSPLSLMSKFINQHSYFILFALFALWMLVGIFPLVCYEGDSLEVIFGCEIMHQDGWSFPPIKGYEYRMQPLTYITVVAIRNILPFFTCQQIYCLVTALSSFVFLIGCIEFARHITHEKRIRILLAAMMLPEIYAIAMYPNSAIPAAALFVWALICICHRRYLVATILMCIAPLFRVDVVIVYPAIFPLFMHEGKTFGKSIIYSAIYALTVIVVCLFFFWLLNARVLTSLNSYDHWNRTIPTSQVLITIFAYYSLAYIILLPLGLCLLIKNKFWKELLLVLLPIVILHYVYRQMGCAAKHYLYISPFVIIAGVRALSWIISVVYEKPILKWISIALVVLFNTISVRIIPPSRPWFEKGLVYNAALIAPIGSTYISSTKVSLGVGAGQYVPTLDEKMIGSGHLFYPLYIHEVKKDMQTSYAKLKTTLEKMSYCNIQAAEWGIKSYIASLFLSDQYQVFVKEGYCTIKGKGKTFNLLNIIWFDEYNVREFLERLHSLTSPQPMDNIYIIVDTQHIRMCFDELVSEGLVEKVEEGLYLLKIKPSI